MSDTGGELAVRDLPFPELDIHTLYALLQLRTDVFVVEQACAYAELDGLDQAARHVWIEEGNAVIACLRLIDDGAVRRIGRVATHRDARSRGLAAVLVAHALENSDGPWELAAQTYLRGWYARFGFVEVGEEYVEDGIPHVDMRREIGPAVADERGDAR